MADELLVNPGTLWTPPQGGYRPRPVSIALPKSEYRPKRAHARKFAAVTSGHSVVTPDLYDEVVCRFQGWEYSQTCDRCGGTCHSFDCSGLQCHVLDLLGIGIGCQNSWTMFSLCWDHGLILPLAVARSTQSHWAGKGADGGRKPEPGTRNGGHIVDGRGVVNGRAETMEAMGTKWGCLIADWDGRGWDVASRIPGVNYAVSSRRRREVITFYDKNGHPKPGKPTGRHACGGPSADGTFIEEWNGASISGDTHAPGDPANLRRWVPRDAAGHSVLGPGQTFTGLVVRDDRKGAYAVRNDGATFDGNFS